MKNRRLRAADFGPEEALKAATEAFENNLPHILEWESLSSAQLGNHVRYQNLLRQRVGAEPGRQLNCRSEEILMLEPRQFLTGGDAVAVVGRTKCRARLTGRIYEVQASTNLVNWETIGTTVTTNGAVSFSDAVIGLSSTGLHSNGFSLVRQIVFDRAGLSLRARPAELGARLGDVLLTPTRIYVRTVRDLLQHHGIKGMAHITGGGITENLPRTLPGGLGFSLDRQSWAIPPLFTWLQRAGRVDDAEMFRTFNMGVGLILVCDPAHAANHLGFAQAVCGTQFVLCNAIGVETAEQDARPVGVTTR
jgi:hypothetical protein